MEDRNGQNRRRQASLESENRLLSRCFDTVFFIANGYPHKPKLLQFQWDFRRIEMTKAKLFVATALLSIALLAPGLAEARHNRHHLHNWGLPYPISFLHNYGPGLQPGTFAYYDGPSTVLCRQGAAAYLGQDRRRHPCY
jgi:hypothetical protein